MERKDFLKGLGLVSAGSLLPIGKTMLSITADESGPLADCTLSPTETEGPYPYPAGGEINNPLNRSDVRETQTGLSLTLTLSVTNLNCIPLSNIRVDIWSCNKDGFYSGYIQPGGNYVGSTFLRGYQLTNGSGEVTFTTVYPGWYNGRINHIHLEIFAGTILKKTTQLCFPDSMNNTVNAFYGRPITGGSPATNQADQVFSDTANTALEIVTLSGSTTSGFTATRPLVIDFAVLPLTLISFDAGISGKNNTLWWKTTSEINTDRFEIEKSTDAVLYSRIASVTAKNDALANNYSSVDQNPASGKSFYRLKMFDRDGSFTYSKIAIVNRRLTQQLSISPNPALDNITLIHPKAGSSGTIKILTVDGRSVAKGKLESGATATLINVNMLPAGAYLLLFENDGDKQVERFIKK